MNTLEKLSTAMRHDRFLQNAQRMTLDDVFEGQRLDILKVDVEGFEEQVLRGADRLLRDAERGPRVLYIEIHPYAWSRAGTTGPGLLQLLHSYGFQATFVDGSPAEKLENYGEIIACRTASPAQIVRSSSGFL